MTEMTMVRRMETTTEVRGSEAETETCEYHTAVLNGF